MDKDLRHAGYGYGSCGCTLAHCLESIGREYGVLREYEYRELLDGYSEGSRDYCEYRRDMELGHYSQVVDWSEVPW